MTRTYTTFADGASGRVALGHHDSLDDAVAQAEDLAGQHGLRYRDFALTKVKDKHAQANAARIVVTDPDGHDVFTTHVRYR